MPTEKPRPWLAEGSPREPLDQPVRRGHHGVEPNGAADLRAASTITEANAEERLVPDSLAPVEGHGSFNAVAPVPPRRAASTVRQMSTI